MRERSSLAYMELNWLYFVPALVLLFYPSYAGGSARLRLCGYEDIRYNRGGAAKSGVRNLRMWLDPARAFAGAWLLRHSWVVEAPLPGVWKYVPLAATMLVIAAALGVQMHTRYDSTVLLAPIGFCTGLVFALLPTQVALLVVVFAAASLMAFRGWWAFFLCGAAAAAGFGYMLLRTNLWMAGSVAVLLEPLFLSLLIKRQLTFAVIPIRKTVVVKRRVIKTTEPGSGTNTKRVLEVTGN